jgi:hypothetical protein
MLLVVVTGWLDRREREAIAYLVEENRRLHRHGEVKGVLKAKVVGVDSFSQQHAIDRLQSFIDEVKAASPTTKVIVPKALEPFQIDALLRSADTPGLYAAGHFGLTRG